MVKCRLVIAHCVRESIVIDVAAPDREMVEAAKDDIYALACGLPGWEMEWAVSADSEVQLLEEPADLFDTPPGVALKYDENGAFVVEAYEEDDRTRAIRKAVAAALRHHRGRCLDDTTDLKAVEDALVQALRNV